MMRALPASPLKTEAKILKGLVIPKARSIVVRNAILKAAKLLENSTSKLDKGYPQGVPCPMPS